MRSLMIKERREESTSIPLTGESQSFMRKTKKHVSLIRKFLLIISTVMIFIMGIGIYVAIESLSNRLRKEGDRNIEAQKTLSQEKLAQQIEVTGEQINTMSKAFIIQLEQTSDVLSYVLRLPIYNLDVEQGENIIGKFVAQQGLRSILVNDANGIPFIGVFRNENNELNPIEKIPEEIVNFPRIEHKIELEGETLGRVILVYEMNHIEEAKQKNLQRQDQLIGETELQQQRIAEEIVQKIVNQKNQLVIDRLLESTILFVIIILAIYGVCRISIIQPLSKIANMLNQGAEGSVQSAEKVLASQEVMTNTHHSHAASLEETSSSMEEMAGQTQNNADAAASAVLSISTISEMLKQSEGNAQSAVKLSKEVHESSENGVHAMSEIVSAMHDISDSSDQITEFIETINEITHQTKMLATNAAIEAARAGEQGKGFAVVADEVSKLAESSKVSAKEINNLVKDSINKAKVGSDLALNGEKVLKEILEQSIKAADYVTKISESSKEQTIKVIDVEDLINRIKSASTEQAHGVTQINTAITTMDRSIQTSAAEASVTMESTTHMMNQAQNVPVLVHKLLLLIKGGTTSDIR